MSLSDDADTAEGGAFSWVADQGGFERLDVREGLSVRDDSDNEV